jgi:hypothetical protein
VARLKPRPFKDTKSKRRSFDSVGRKMRAQRRSG